MSPSWEETAEKVTQQAIEAAEEGRWGRVDLCYQERAELFRAKTVSLSLGRRLHVLDRRVHDRLRMAMMTAQHLLVEVASKRRLIERFDSGPQSAVSPDGSRRISYRL